MAGNKLKTIVKNTLIVLLIALVIIQFIRPAKNIDSNITAQDITKMYEVPDSVQRILQKACYDCHSNNTHYPWYNNLQPVAWWMSDHIKDGKHKVNFSEFGKLPFAKRIKKLKKSAKEVQSGDMPLDSYTWIHKDAILTDGEKQYFITWANNLAQQISLSDTTKQ